MKYFGGGTDHESYFRNWNSMSSSIKKWGLFSAIQDEVSYIISWMIPNNIWD